MKNILIKTLIFLAVTAIIILLMMINTKLLIHLNWIKTGNFLLDDIAVLISGLAFALGSISVVIWYNKGFGSVLLKIAFAVLDGFHVYIYNNSHVEDLAMWVSPIFAVQTALILFFIGNVVHGIMNEEKTDIVDYESQIKLLKSNLYETSEDLRNYTDGYNGSVEKSNKLQSQLQAQLQVNEKLTTDINNLESDLNAVELNAVGYANSISALHEKNKIYEPVYIKSEVSRIKKKTANRTEEEQKFLEKHSNEKRINTNSNRLSI